MAVYGAHITSTTPDNPSIFDVVAQESLMSSLQPALKHLLQVISESNPGRFSWCCIYNEEIFAIFNAIIQQHYLRQYGASFSENFYDLKRIASKSISESQHPLSLPYNSYIRSLVTLVGFQYLYTRLDNLFQQLRLEEADGQSPEKAWKRRLRNVYLKLWPLIHFVWEFSKLIFFLRYMTGQSRVHSPLLYCSGVRLSLLTEEDYEIIEQRSKSLLNFENIRSIRQTGRWIVERVGSSLMNSLEVGAFFLQFLDWFYSSGHTSSSLTAAVPTLPPPQEQFEDISGTFANQCPICLKVRQKDTACSVSGYVFCYACILMHVRREGACPVTGYPVTTSQLIRIYDNF